MWPMDVVVQAGGWLLFEVASTDTDNVEPFKHRQSIGQSADMALSRVYGVDYIHLGESHEDYITLPT